MDLSISLDSSVLNLRVAVLINTPSGFIFEKSKDGYLFTIGGRIKLHESTTEACVRELMEELNLKSIPIRMIGIVENFFQMNENQRYHEINFVFKANLSESIELNSLTSDNNNLGYLYVKPEDFSKYEILPKVMIEIMQSNKPFLHIVNKE